MKKIFIAFLTLSLLFLSASCSTLEPKEPIATPEWWEVMPQDSEYVHYVIGLAKTPNSQIAKQWAKSDAMKQLGEYMNLFIDKTIESITITADDGEIKGTLEYFRESCIQRSNAILNGITFEYHIDDEGTMMALGELPLKPMMEEFKAAAGEALNGKLASEKANAMMDRAFDKLGL